MSRRAALLAPLLTALKALRYLLPPRAVSHLCLRTLILCSNLQQLLLQVSGTYQSSDSSYFISSSIGSIWVYAFSSSMLQVSYIVNFPRLYFIYSSEVFLLSCIILPRLWSTKASFSSFISNPRLRVLKEDEDSSLFFDDFSFVKLSLSKALFLLVLQVAIGSSSSSERRETSDLLVATCFFSRSFKLGYFLIPSSSLLIIPRLVACSRRVSRQISSMSVCAEHLLRRSLVYFQTLVRMKALFRTSMMDGLSWVFLDSIEAIRSRNCFEQVGMIEGQLP